MQWIKIALLRSVLTTNVGVLLIGTFYAQRHTE